MTLRLTLLVCAAICVAACGSSSGLSPRVLPDPTAGPSGLASGPASAPGPSASSSAGLAGSSGQAAVNVDPGLLSFLPVTGNGLLQIADPDSAATIAEDPVLRSNAAALMIATYVPLSTGASAAPAEDFAVVSVVRLRDPSVDDAWFRDWRDSYDAAVCAQAGGVSRNSQTDIGTHTVYVGACAGGSFTYHTRIAAGAIVISINSIGPANLGRTVMERLAP